MSSSQETLTDSSLSSSVITLTVDSPKIELISGLQRFDAVKVLHSMDNDPAAGQIMHIFRGDSQSGNPNPNREIELSSAKVGDKIQFVLVPQDSGARSVVLEYRT